jgi:hypothetical protein
MFTPNHIEVLLHYHVSVEEHPRPLAPAVQEAVQWFLDVGLLEPSIDKGFRSPYHTTERARVLIDAWCSQPLPVQVWVIPATRESAGGQ